MPTQPFTISVAFVHGMLSGIRPDPVLLASCLSRSGIAAGVLDQAGGRITAEQYVTLYGVLMAQREDEGLGFFSRPLHHGTIALIMRNTLGAATVDVALRRLCRALELVQDDVRIDTVQQDQLTGVRVMVPPAYMPDRIYVHELLLRVISRMLAWLHGGRLRPFGFDFAYPVPPQVDEYHKLFPGRVRFDQACSAVWFPSAMLRVPLRRDDAALRAFLANSPRNLVVPQRDDSSTGEKIRAYLQQGRPQWPDLPTTAQALNLSVSTLQRHLANEGSSFQLVKDQLRRDLAIVRLNTSTVPIAVLAAELGFSDQAVFQRAFKTWTGSAPGAYRERG